MLTEIIIMTYLFVTGSCIGSFLNVCIYRMPAEISVVKPRSHCPKCKKEIPWYQNVPIIAYIVLKGKCAFCKTHIPIRYVLMEVLTGSVFLGVYFLTGLSLLYFIQVTFISMMIVIIATDIEHYMIPDAITLPGMIIGLVFSIFSPELFPQALWYHRLLSSFIGLFGAGAMLYAVAMIGDWVFKKESMGGGDIKLLAMFGAFLGFEKAFLVFMLSPFIALPFAIYQRLTSEKEPIPYGPYLAIMGIVFLLFGEFMMNMILKIYGV